MRSIILPTLAALATLLGACAHTPSIDSLARTDTRENVIEATSLLQAPLVRPELTDDTRARLQANLDEAWANWQANPTDEMTIIWLGRRLAYLSRYNDAITVFTNGLKLHPNSHKLLRHRGHRSITLRRFDDAIADLSRAAELIESRNIADATEPDGAPNAQNIPLSTTNSNIFYHLALAHYCKGEYDQALAVHNRGAAYNQTNDDQKVSHAYWRYRTLRELNRDDEARAYLDDLLSNAMYIIENTAYYHLLLAYQTANLNAAPNADNIYAPTYDFGIAAEHAANDNPQATRLFQNIIEGEGSWAAFGYIAAEARLAAKR